jgi:hypothetical protein
MRMKRCPRGGENGSFLLHVWTTFLFQKDHGGRQFTAEQGIGEEQASQAGMEQKAREFVEKGGELYAKT